MSREQEWDNVKLEIRKLKKKENEARAKLENVIERVNQAEEKERVEFIDLRLLQFMKDTDLPQIMHRPFAEEILSRSMTADQVYQILDNARLPRSVLQIARVVSGSLILQCKSVATVTKRPFELNVRKTKWFCERCEFISDSGAFIHRVDLDCLFHELKMEDLLAYADQFERTEDQQFRITTKWTGVYSFSLRNDPFPDDCSESVIEND